MLQSLVVWSIVLAAALLVGRRLYRTFSGRGPSGCCGSTACTPASCDAAGQCPGPPADDRCHRCSASPPDRAAAPPLAPAAGNDQDPPP